MSGGAVVIAFLGKGGAGKTALSALTARVLADRGTGRALMIDADPAGGLVHALAVSPPHTVGEARDRVIREAKQSAGSKRVSGLLDYMLLEALVEGERLSFLSMGRTEGPGCYCPVNTLLRESIEELAQSFDYIVIDAEAGLEQVSRQVTRRVDHPLIVTDGSVRGVRAAIGVAGLLRDLEGASARGVIFNRSAVPPPAQLAELDAAGLAWLGSVPPDALVAAYDAEGRSLLELPPDSPALVAFRDILINAGILD